MPKETWYFTFGCGQPNAGYCQPIEAPNYASARTMMCAVYGIKWAFQYSAEQWERAGQQSTYLREIELPTIVSTYD